MIYLDNAATGGFKPYSVLDAAESVMKFLSANPGRGAHRLSLTGANVVYGTREIIAETFSATPERVIFTKNCTEALNTAIIGTAKKGGHIICTCFEHNSVLRPLYYLKNNFNIDYDIVFPLSNKSITEAVKEKIKDDTYMIICTAISNVTGEVMPLKEIGKICKEKNILFLVDGAQGGGHIPLDMTENNISLLALAGHKGLCGIMGSGILIIDQNVSVSPITFGGTGTETFNAFQPEVYPERLEAGTLNLPAIAALNEGVRYVKNNLNNFAENLTGKTAKVIEALSSDKTVIYSKPNPAGIVAFKLLNKDASEVGDILNAEYDIAVRCGFHCAPKTHEFLGTEKDGLIRASMAVQNSMAELNFFVRAIKEISKR